MSRVIYEVRLGHLGFNPLNGSWKPLMLVSGQPSPVPSFPLYPVSSSQCFSFYPVMFHLASFSMISHPLSCAALTSLLCLLDNLLLTIQMFLTNRFLKILHQY